MPRTVLPVSGIARCPWCTRDEAKLHAIRKPTMLQYYVECSFCGARSQVLTYEAEEIPWALDNEKDAVKEITDVWGQVSNALLELYPTDESEAASFERRIIHIRNPNNPGVQQHGVICKPPIIKRRYRNARYLPNELRWWHEELEYT